jgi:hypothetical protein
VSYASTVGDAITALTAVLAASSDLAGVKVGDGATLTDPDAADVISVGYVGPDTDDMAADGAMTPEGPGGRQDRENYVIHCAAASLNGDDDQAAARARVLELLAAAGAAVTANRTLRGTVMSARVGTWSLRQDHTTSGAFARIRFDVNCDAYTRK